MTRATLWRPASTLRNLRVVEHQGIIPWLDSQIPRTDVHARLMVGASVEVLVRGAQLVLGSLIMVSSIVVLTQIRGSRWYVRPDADESTRAAVGDVLAARADSLRTTRCSMRHQPSQRLTMSKISK